MHHVARRITVAAIALTAACASPGLLVPDDSLLQLAHTTVTAPNPGEPGTYAVKFLYYGSGGDRRRPEYRDSLALRTRAVNGTPYLRGGDKKALKKRWDYWGFDEKRLPVNARVWYPDGAGPFPLVLIVHGNHDMKKFSDPGYAYLGRHLASRGYILASVDENFLNGDLRDENDARGWMLLQHLVVWRRWNADSTSPFYRKVDLTRIALAGHSRGGEAVAVAAAFNRLSRYPDDARVTFDFGFDIRTVIAISPVDGQYKPAGLPTPLENVNYFVIHGSHDSDVQTFMGLRQYERVRFTEGGDWVKAGVYVYRANHGQFNTVWGDNDVGDSGWLLNKRLLLTGDEQRQVAKVFIGGFLDLTLRGQRAYLPMFLDHRAAGGWLPKTIYLSRFDLPTTRVLADFEGGIDVTRGSAAGVRLSGQHLATWKDVALTMRSRGLQPFNNNAIMLGWLPPDTMARAGVGAGAGSPPVAAGNEARASYTITLPDTLAAAWKLTRASSLVFALANYGELPTPLARADTAAPLDSAERAALAARRDSTKATPDSAATTPGEKPAKTAAAPPPLDLTVELVMADGRTASLLLSAVAPVRPPLTVRLWRWQYVEQRLFPPAKNHEDVLASYRIPFARFSALLDGFDPRNVRAVRLVFDRAPGGTILLDDVGFDVGTPPG